MKGPSLAATTVLAAFLLLATSAIGEWIETAPALRNQSSVELLKSTERGCVLEIRVPRIWVEDVIADGRVYQRISLPEAGLSGSVGGPEVPYYSPWLTVPPYSGVTTEVVDADYTELQGFNVHPVQRPLPEIHVSQPEFVIDEALYSKDEYLPAIQSKAGSPCLFRDQRIASVGVYPIQYNPVNGILRVATRMRVNVSFESHSAENIPRRTDTAADGFKLLQEEFLLNYSPTGSQVGSYLVITADTFSQAVQPLADWKMRKGYPTVVTNLSSIPPGDSAAIHGHIQNAYDTWVNPPEYVLLVGDVEYLPAGMHEGIYPPPWGYYYNYGTDHCYSLVAGSDEFSDVFIGRLPVNSAEECSVLVTKILDYEIRPDTSSLDWFEQASAVGVLQSGRIFQQTCRKVKEIMQNGGYSQVDTLFEGSSPPGFATPGDICDSLNDGRTFLLYRGHGAQDGWWTDGHYNILATEHVDTLGNASKTPVVIAPTCLANAFFDEGQVCVGEAFVLQEAGAVGYFGATDVSYSFWNDSLAIGIFRGIFEEGAYHFQQGCNYGKLFMEKYYPLSDPSNGEVTSQEFFFMNILGDPELPLRTGTPKPLLAVHVDTVGTGLRLLSILAESEGSPVLNALVCVMKDAETYASGYTDGSGLVELSVNPLTEGAMDVTATARNCLPYYGNIAVVAAPAAPELLLPQDYAVFADSTPQFVWSRTVSDSGNYELTLAMDSTLVVDPVVVDSLTDTTHVFPTGLDDGLYFWGVQAFDENSHSSGYQSHKFSFTVDCTPPLFEHTTVLSDTSFAGPFDIYSRITDLTGVFGPTLYYRVSPDTAWSPVSMDSSGVPDSFHVQIPAQISGVTVDYYLTASDFSDPINSGYDPPGAPASHFSFSILSVGVQELKRGRIPTEFALSDANPNPFLHGTQVRYQVPQECRLRITVYDAAGRVVNCIVDEILQPGYHQSHWDGIDSEGRPVNSGVYFYRMETPGFTSSKKVLLLK